MGQPADGSAELCMKQPGSGHEPAGPSAPGSRFQQSPDAAIEAAFGLFKGRVGFPQDGLQFQREARTEWD